MEHGIRGQTCQIYTVLLILQWLLFIEPVYFTGKYITCNCFCDYVVSGILYLGLFSSTLVDVKYS